MGFFKNFGKGANGGDGKSNIDPVLAAFEESGLLVEMLHISSGKMCVFPAWVTDFSDSYNSAWNAENVFGRNDRIGVFQGTSRMINISLGIPSFSVVEARENMHQLEHMIAHLYPSYKSYSGTDTMSGSPLLKLKFANLIKNANKRTNALPVNTGGLSGWVDTLTFTPDLEAGFHHMSPNMNAKDQQAYNGHFENRRHTNASHTLIPKVLNLTFNFNVVHEHSLGWKGKSWAAEAADSFPYGIETLSGGQHAGGVGTTATTRTKGKVAQKLISQAFKGGGKI